MTMIGMTVVMRMPITKGISIINAYLVFKF